MQPAPLSPPIIRKASFVDTLMHPQSEIAIGYCFGGDRPGPKALFAAWSPTIVAVSQRLVNLPTLPWMWGHLHLVALDRFKVDDHAEIAGFLLDISFDEVSILTDPKLEKLAEHDLESSYWTVLRMCSGLGMIQGRGVRAPDK